MAAAKRRFVKRQPKTGIVTDPANPQSWLFLHSAEPSVGLVFGVLRKTYADRADNTALAFGTAKLCPVTGGNDAAGHPVPTAARHDVVLPRDAADELAEPFALLEAMDETAVNQDLLVYITVAFPEVTRLHQAWEALRGFAVLLARERKLASLVVLHAPGLVSSPNPVHGHLCIGPRTVAPLGMRHGTYDRELIRDGGQAVLARLWRDHREG